MPSASSRRVAAQITGFFFAVVGLFVLISHLVPQVSSHPPRALGPEDFNRMTPEQRVAKGKEIFGSGGERCSQCHMIEGVPGRGPNLGGLGARAVARAQERGRSAGKPYQAVDYLIESMIEPNAYIVQGYSSPSIMPEVYKPPLDLSEHDIFAVAAYLESLGGGVSATEKIELPAEWKSRIIAAKSASKEPLRGSLPNGKELFYNRMRCVACHATTVQGKAFGGALGPDLSRVGAIRGPEGLKNIITNPPGDIMPKHYGENLTKSELDDLVVFLISLRSS